jgi:hypothetical protein
MYAVEKALEFVRILAGEGSRLVAQEALNLIAVADEIELYIVNGASKVDPDRPE